MYYRVLQGIAEYYRVLQNVTEYYKAFLAHLLGPIFGLVYRDLVDCFANIILKTDDINQSRFASNIQYIKTFLVSYPQKYRSVGG